MELSVAQIQKVENYLSQKGFEYLDLKIEVLDHMIFDIETEMSKNISFQNAFKIAILKWERYFKESNSFYFGMFYTSSKIVIQKAKKVFQFFYFIYLSAYLLPLVFLKLFPITLSGSSIYSLNSFITLSSTASFIYIFYIALKLKTSKLKTTYSFIIKTQYLGSIFLILGGVIGAIFEDSGKMNPVFTGFVLAGYSVTFICYHFYKKHKEVILKYKIS